MKPTTILSHIASDKSITLAYAINSVCGLILDYFPHFLKKDEQNKIKEEIKSLSSEFGVDLINGQTGAEAILNIELEFNNLTYIINNYLFSIKASNILARYATAELNWDDAIGGLVDLYKEDEPLLSASSRLDWADKILNSPLSNSLELVFERLKHKMAGNFKDGDDMEQKVKFLKDSACAQISQTNSGNFERALLIYAYFPHLEASVVQLRMALLVVAHSAGILRPIINKKTRISKD